MTLRNKTILLLPYFAMLLMILPGSARLAGQSVNSVDFNTLEARFRSGSDTLYLVNFWATWCKPCVEELPYFEAFHEQHVGKPVKVLMVSLDFNKHIESKLLPFLRERGLKPEVVHLNETNPNAWIDRVNPTWSGAIPASLVRKGNVEYFHEGAFPDMDSLESFVKQIP